MHDAACCPRPAPAGGRSGDGSRSPSAVTAASIAGLVRSCVGRDMMSGLLVNGRAFAIALQRAFDGARPAMSCSWSWRPMSTVERSDAGSDGNGARRNGRRGSVDGVSSRGLSQSQSVILGLYKNRRLFLRDGLQHNREEKGLRRVAIFKNMSFKRHNSRDLGLRVIENLEYFSKILIG